ncbi:hypothetical protein WJX74_005626 [Apatococcus lobatus]|uniref:Sm domain-containing protein n=1 Tax=Apatococcus lobatus TaxID=904363 RepID=A0AAW1Q9P3_9CHLO
MADRLGHTQDRDVSRIRDGHRSRIASPSEDPSTPALDPELDFLGPHFNALKALRTKGMQPPNIKVRPLDNVYLTRGLLPDDDPDSFVARLAKNPRPVRSEEAKAQIARDKSRVLYVARERERLAEKGSALERLVARVTRGPLLLLRRCYENKTAVRVVTRHSHGVRGVATGHLLGFDKYMNMVLQNVEESYTVLLRVQRSKLVILTEGPAAGQEIENVRWVKQQDKRRRHLRQVLLRGDSVVLVSPAPNYPAQPAAKRSRD